MSLSRGSAELQWNSDLPTLSALTLSNSPLTGSKSISVFGSSYSENDFSAAVRMGRSSCESTLWTSSSSMHCKGISGFGSPVFFMSVQRRLASLSVAFSYDQHSMFVLSPGNGPATGRVSVTVLGVNFGKVESSVSAKLGPYVSLGPTAFLMSSWTSDSSVRLLIPGGAGENLNVTVDANNRATAATMFSFDLPVIRQLSIRTCSTTGTCMLFIRGLNFASANEMVSVSMGPSNTPSLGFTNCGSLVVYNDNLLSCEIPGGAGKLISIAVTVNSQESTLTRAFSYLQPVVFSAGTPSNAPGTGAVSITTFGTYFGYYSNMNKRVVTHGSTATSEVTWISDTCVISRRSHGSTGKLSVLVTIWWQVASVTSAFSADAPAVQVLAPVMSMSTGSSVICVIGSNYGLVSLSSAASVSRTSCTNSLWLSSSNIFSKASSGSAAGLAIAVSSEMQFSSTTRLLSYAIPSLHETIVTVRVAAPSTGAVDFIVLGRALSASSSLVIRFGDTSCPATTWTSDSSLVSKVHSAAGSNLAFQVSVASQKSDSTIRQSYASPQIAALMSLDVAVSGSTSITITANGLTENGRSQRVSVGRTACSSSKWVSSSCLMCKLLPGVGLHRSVSISSASQAGFHSSLLSYNKPSPLELQAVTTLPATGTFSISIRGSMFAYESAGPLLTDAHSHAVLKAGSTVCMKSTWKSDSSLICRLAPAVGVRLSVEVSIFLQAGQVSMLISYEGATISGVDKQFLPASGAVSVSLYGSGFGTSHSSLVVIVGSSNAQISKWTSDSSALCKAHVVGGASIQIRASVSKHVGHASSTYLSLSLPVISALTNANLAKSGSVSVTILGSSFTLHRSSIASRFRSSSSFSSVWQSDSSLISKAVMGREARLGMVVSVGFQKSMSEVFWASYDAILAIASKSVFIPATGSSSVTLFGNCFGFASYSQTIRHESSATESLVWVSDSAIVSKSGVGSGPRLSLTASLNLISFITNAVSFNIPAPVGLSGSAPPVSGSISSTLIGFRFGRNGISQRTVFGGTSSLSTEWVSDSILNQKVPSGTSISLLLKASINRLFGTTSSVITFNSPDISSSIISALPTTGFQSVTLIGKNFGQSNWSPVSSFGASTSIASNWLSDSSIKARVSAGSGQCLSASISVALLLMKSSGPNCTLSYLKPLSNLVSLAIIPTTGDTMVAISGFGFGNPSSRARIVDSSCKGSFWRSDSFMTCKSAAGFGVDLALSVSTNKQQFSTSSLLTFSRAILSSLSSSNAPSSGSISITISGTMFSSVGNSAVVRLVGAADTKVSTSFQISMWKSDSSVLAKISFGYGKISCIVSVAKQASFYVLPAAAWLTWDVVTTVRLTDANAPTTGSVYLHVTGSNMGSRSICNVAVLGATSSQSTIWTSDSILRVKVSNGLSNRVAASVSVFSSMSVGSLSNSLTFALPHIGSVNPSLATTSGSVSVTAQGRGFGLSSHTSSFRLGSTNSLAFSWRSDSSVVVKVSSSAAIYVIMTSTSAHQTASMSFALSFDVHQLLAETQASPTTGSISMSIIGLRFGTWDFTSSSIRHENSAAIVSVWTSQSSVRCKLASGFGHNIGVVASVRQAISTFNGVLSYLSPALSSESPLNIASTSSISVTVFGNRFGVVAMSSRIRMSGTASRSESWKSDSSIVNRVSYVGFSVSFEVATVSVALQYGSSIGLKLSFDKPSLRMLETLNTPSSGSSSLSIVGNSFGKVNFSPKVAIFSSRTEASRWTASSSVSLKISRGAFVHMKDIVISTDSRFGSVSDALSFDVASVSSIGAVLVALTGSISVTAVGANLGSFSISMKLVLDSSTCAISNWKSDSTIDCKVVRGAGHSLRALVSGALNTPRPILTKSISYSSPAISSLNSNAPKSGSVSLTVSGTGFASFGVCGKSRIHDSALEGSAWMSDSCMVVKVSSGRHVVHVSASVMGAYSSSNVLFTYNMALLSSSSPTNAPTSGSLSVSVQGKSFAPLDYSRNMITFSITASECLMWTSDSSIISKVPSGVRGVDTLKVSMMAMMNSITSFFSRDAPTLISLEHMQIPASGAFFARIIGLGLGHVSYSQKALVDGSSCASISWQSDSSLTCKIIAGSKRLVGGVFVASSSSLSSQSLNVSVIMSAHQLSSHSPDHLASTGSQSVTISGIAFGVHCATLSLKLKRSAVEATIWVSDSSTLLTSFIEFQLSQSHT